MEFYAWSLVYTDSERGPTEILQGLILKQRLPGFVLAVSRMRDYLSGLELRLNGVKVDHIAFDGETASIRAS